MRCGTFSSLMALFVILTVVICPLTTQSQDFTQDCHNANCDSCTNVITQLSASIIRVYAENGQFWLDADASAAGIAGNRPNRQIVIRLGVMVPGVGTDYWFCSNVDTTESNCGEVSASGSVSHYGLGANPKIVRFLAKLITDPPAFYCGCDAYIEVPVDLPPTQPELDTPPCLSQIGDPIDARSGNVYYSQRDATIGSWSGMPIILARSYNSGDTVGGTGVLGPKWTHSLDYRIADDGDGFVKFTTGGGQVLRLKNSFFPVGIGNQYQVTFDSASGRYTVFEYPTARRYVFTPSGRLDSLLDRNYPRLTFTYNLDTLTRVTDAAGRFLDLHYNAGGKLDSLRPMAGDPLAVYEYDTNLGDTLKKVTYNNGDWEEYTYNSSYMAHGLLSQVLTSDGTRLHYRYNANAQATWTDVNDTLNQDSISRSLAIRGDTVFSVTAAIGSDTRTFESIMVSDSTRRVHSTITNSSCGCGSAFQYDGQYQTRSVEYVNGRKDSLQHATHGQVSSFWRDYGGPDERRTDYTFGGAYDRLQTVGLPSLHSANHAVLTFTRDSVGNATWIKWQGYADSSSYYADSSKFVYGSEGELLRIDGPLTDTTDTTGYQYYANGDLHKIVDALGHTIEFGNLDSLGNLTWVRSSNGDTTRYSFDDYGRMISATRWAGEAGSLTTAIEYNYAGKVTKVTYPRGNFVEYVYDDNNLLRDIQDQLGQKIHYNYDRYSRPNLEAVVDTNGDTVTYQSYHYTPRGQVDEIRNPDNTYSTFSYDDMGNLGTATDANGNSVEFIYDLLNRVDTAWTSNGGVVYQTFYHYDANGNLSEVIDPDSNRYVFSYSDNGLLIYDSCAATAAHHYSYDPQGNLKTLKNATGDSVIFAYDAINRLTDITHPDGQDLEYTYDGTQYSYGLGRLYQEIAPASTSTFRYDKYGHLYVEYRTTSGDTTTHQTSYLYDQNGNITRIGYPSGLSYSYVYDSLDRVTMVTWTMSTGHYAFDTLAYNIKYDPFGDAVEWTLGNGIVVSQSHNSRYFTDTIATDASNIMGRAYEFDSVGNVTYIKDLVDSLNSARFVYDSLYRLTNAASSRYPDSVRTYEYSKNGNRITLEVDTGAASRTIEYVYQNNRLWQIVDTVTTILTYDTLGNLRVMRTGTDSTTYEYNDAGQLVSVDGGATAQYHYDGRGRRVKVIAGSSGRYVYYDQFGRIISEFRTSNGNWDRDFVYLNGRILAKLEKHYSGGIEKAEGGELLDGIEPPPPTPLPTDIDLFYYHTDHLGTPLVVTNTYGTVAWKARYSPFGELTYEWTNTTNYIRFPGQWEDDVMGLNYNWHRYYDPRTGRYTQADPIGLAGGINLYAYAGDNPVGNIDPTGLDILPFLNKVVTYASDAVGFVLMLDPVSVHARAIFAQIKPLIPDYVRSGWVFGTDFGESATDNWACRYNKSHGIDRVGAFGMGLAASLWTEDTWFKTAATLATAEVLSGSNGATLGGRAGIAEGTAERQIAFQSEHASRHLRGTGLSTQAVESNIVAQIRLSVKGASETGHFWGRVTLDGGRVIEYRAFTLPYGTINVGTYYMVAP